jgi:hypothetical protein
MLEFIRKLLKKIEHLLSLYVNSPTETLPVALKIRCTTKLIKEDLVRINNPIRAGPGFGNI